MEVLELVLVVLGVALVVLGVVLVVLGVVVVVLEVVLVVLGVVWVVPGVVLVSQGSPGGGLGGPGDGSVAPRGSQKWVFPVGVYEISFDIPKKVQKKQNGLKLEKYANHQQSCKSSKNNKDSQ